MAQVLAILLGALYCFTWLRIPQDVIGQILPAQRIISWLGLLAIFIYILFKKPPALSEQAKSYLGTTAFFLVYLFVDLACRLIATEGQFLSDSYFDFLAFISDFAKYLGSFSAAFLVYFALKQKPKIEELFIRSLLFSGTACIFLTIIFVGLFYAGFSTENDVLAPTFGGTVGVWPTGGLIPRLAGTTAEPQQFSIVFLTPMFLMLTKRYIRQFWPIALLSFVALLLSQSKFALISIVFVVIYVFVIYKPYRFVITLASALLSPLILYILSNLPVFTQTLEEGLESQAVTERASNAGELIFIAFSYPITGIGAGQYAPFVNWFVGGEVLPKGYTPNLDYLKILSETGIIGFLLMITLLVSLVRNLYGDLKYIPEDSRDSYFAFLLSGTVILLSMFFSYEFLHAIFWINLGYLIYVQDCFSAEIKQGKSQQRNMTAPEIEGLSTPILIPED